MRILSSRAWPLAVLLFTIPLGCTSSRPPLKKTPPPDPLLMSKTPVQAKFGTTLDVHARPDPVPPGMPVGAWAQAPPETPSIHLASPGSGPAPYRVTAEKHEVPSEGWVKGVVEKSADGQWLLRVESGPTVPVSGKLILEGHSRLDLFEPGYVIRVQGRVVEEPVVRSSGTWLPHPRYHVEQVELIRR
jgi:hypothetical protein